MKETHQQLLRFLVVGLTSVAVDLSMYSLLGWGFGLPSNIAKALSFWVGVVVGFIGNKYWTFKSRSKSLAEPLTHVAVYSVTMCVNVGCNEVVLGWLGTQGAALAYAAATGVSTVLNFLGMRLVTFRHAIHQQQQASCHSTVFNSVHTSGQTVNVTNPGKAADAGRRKLACASAASRKANGLLTQAYAPGHDENRMHHEGDTRRAREYFFHGAPQNLKVLLKQRYEWMNRFIGADDLGVEVGCGTGISREFIRSNRYYLSDVADYDWIDFKDVDAMNTSFHDETFDFVVSSNMIHHVARPLEFFHEMARILKPGGRLIIQEVNASLAMRVVLRLMRHEGYSYEPDVFDPEAICNDPADPWSANCAIPNLLFDDRDAFERNVPAFRMVHTSFREFACMFNCGGVIAKTFCLPLPKWMVYLMHGIDTILTAVAPSLFAMQRQIVLEKRQPEKISLSLVGESVERAESNAASRPGLLRQNAA